MGKSTELERTLPSGNCSRLRWQVHGHVGGIMTELLKWAEGQESQEASTPEWNQFLILCWQLGPRSENLRLSVLDRSLRDHPVQSCHLTHREIEAHREWIHPGNKLEPDGCTLASLLSLSVPCLRVSETLPSSSSVTYFQKAQALWSLNKEE